VTLLTNFSFAVALVAIIETPPDSYFWTLAKLGGT